jgi:hypothetical protein
MQDIIFKLSYPTAGLDTSLGLVEVEASKPARQSVHEGDKGWELYALAAFIPQEIFLVLISVKGRVDPRP